MPERKKPSRASTSKPASARTSARKAAPKTAKKAAAKKPVKKPAAKRPTPKRGQPESELLTPLDLDGLGLDDDELDAEEPEAEEVSREVAVAEGPFVLDGETDLSQPMLVRFDDREVPPPQTESQIEVEKPREEILAGVAALVLAASVFLSWFGPPGLPVTGWEGGLWGPVIFFTSLAVVAIVAIRRSGAPIALPVDHSAIIEAVGWLAVLGALASRLFGAQVNGTDYKATTWVFVPILAGVALALLASRISTGSPFVLRPGWFDGTGGKIGAAILAFAVLGGVGFGVTGDATPGRNAAPRQTDVKQYSGKLPPCASAVKFPVPATVTLAMSFQLPQDNCNVTFSSSSSLSKLVAAYKSALKAAGWKFVATAAPKSMTFQLTAPRCGTLSLSELGGTGTTLASPSPKVRAKVTGFAVFSPTCSFTPGGTRHDQPPS